jgi:preprotein translocase subunit SecF
VLALFFGIVVGTYSSIFIATPVLVLWQRWRTKS